MSGVTRRREAQVKDAGDCAYWPIVQVSCYFSHAIWISLTMHIMS